MEISFFSTISKHYNVHVPPWNDFKNSDSRNLFRERWWHMGTPFHYANKTHANASLGTDTILQRLLISQQWGRRNGCVWMVPNAGAKFQLCEFLNMCQGGENASMCLGLCGNTVILQQNTWTTCNVVMISDSIPMTWWTLLNEHPSHNVSEFIVVKVGVRQWNFVGSAVNKVKKIVLTFLLQRTYKICDKLLLYKLQIFLNCNDKLSWPHSKFKCRNQPK